MKQNPEFFKRAQEFDFDIFTFADQIGRMHALTYLTMHLMVQLPSQPLNNQYNEEKMVTFLNTIQSGYRKQVEYHNDLHGADVM